MRQTWILFKCDGRAVPRGFKKETAMMGSCVKPDWLQFGEWIGEGQIGKWREQLEGFHEQLSGS